MKPFASKQVLDGLKDFQRRTVQHVFRRMFLDKVPATRFLVADEVGLGKTKVAQGLLALTVEHLQGRQQTINAVYICSSSDIAKQNVARLQLPGEHPVVAKATRLTLLACRDQEEDEEDRESRKLNLVAFTPGTSFDLKSNLGLMNERVLLFHLVQRSGFFGIKPGALKNILLGRVDRDRFQGKLAAFEERFELNEAIADLFAEAIQKDTGLLQAFVELGEAFARARDLLPKELAQQRNAFVGKLREVLATCCLRSLEPDLIILDEFQRFKHLLQGEGEEAELARALFEYAHGENKVRVLLLSATPYKMFTVGGDAVDNHYADFATTLAFLEKDLPTKAQAESLLEQFRAELMRLDVSSSKDELLRLKTKVEQVLRRVMVRTERLALSEDRSGMLKPVSHLLQTQPEDLRAFLSLQRVSDALGEGDMVSFWKSVPYPLNFMDEYNLKRRLRELAKENSSELRKTLEHVSPQGGLLNWEDIEAYRPIPLASARLRWLLGELQRQKAFELLWVPPSMPYYELAGAYAQAAGRGFTKRLLFSAWRAVPSALACLITYEAERHMLSGEKRPLKNTPEARQRHVRPLRFNKSKEGLHGMTTLGLIYPCRALAHGIDPLRLRGTQGRPLSLERALVAARAQVREMLKPLRQKTRRGQAEDERWYWAAPILLDRLQEAEPWLDEDVAEDWSGVEASEEDHEGDSAWEEHVQRAQAIRLEDLGRPPADLDEVLALLALGGPGVCTLRAFLRQEDEDGDERAEGWAGRVARGFLSLFNLREVYSMLRGQEPYWRRVLRHAAEGGLQAVLDEYVHFLAEALSLRDKPGAIRWKSLAEALVSVLRLRSSSLRVDRIEVESESVRIDTHSMRSRFAVRFGDAPAEGEDGQAPARPGQVKDAFNSPFWPFVLATTSLGQEGLDFHAYAHAIVHWDLPSNPVDLEQREGRLHRYKGHAVRKNLAGQFGLPAMPDPTARAMPDPWETLFQRADRERPEGETQVVPYWVQRGAAHLERHVPLFPLSREQESLQRLLHSLVLYRLAFGQPRQEDLVAYLSQRIPPEETRRLVAALRLDLGPG